MSNCSGNKNPLSHNGSSQLQRLLPALQDGYARVDEKGFADWIVFAKNFSQYLHYYDVNGAQSGNWSVFFSNDLCAILGDIAVQDVDAYKRGIKKRFDFLKDDDSKEKLNALKTNLNDLFSAVTSFALSLDAYYQLLPAGAGLKVLIENIIPANLARPLEKLLRYYEAAKALNFLPATPLAADAKWKVLGSTVTDASLLESSGLSKIWWQHSATSLQEYYAAVKTTKDDSIFGRDLLKVYESINHAANHNLFAAVFQQFLMAYSRLVSSAEKELVANLEKQNDHAPHYALFLAFLKLFRLAQNDINTITQRHLDFYYKEVLQLNPKPAVPNSVHVIAELAKPVNDFVLSKNLMLKAGKDSNGKEVLYATKDETVFNKAVVTSLCSVYFGETNDADDINGKDNDGRLFAAPVINSADGMGTELKSANKEWHPFANKKYTEGNLSAVKMPKAEIGFAIASHYLYLQEGKRKIILRIAVAGQGTLAGKHFKIYLTTEKKWYKVTSNIDTGTATFPGTNEACTEISFALPGSAPPITNYNAAVHGASLNVNVPVMKLVLVNKNEITYDYNAVKDINVTKFQVEAGVGKRDSNNEEPNGIKDLQVITSAGPADVSKPFQPFGAQPSKDAVMIIGNKELFSKKKATLSLNIKWAGISDFDNLVFDDTAGYRIKMMTRFNKGAVESIKGADIEKKQADPPNVKVDFLKDGLWDSIANTTAIFDDNKTNVTVFSNPIELPHHSLVNFAEEYKTYSAESTNGFMRFVLNDGFGHAAHQLALAKYLIAQAKSPKDTTVNDPGDPPYTPVIQSLSISYSACSDIVDTCNNNEEDFNKRPLSFFHIAPFGEAEQHVCLNSYEKQFLFPQFSHTEGAVPVSHQAEFYIGLKNLQAYQSVNILFQVMDGTANPIVEKPVEHIHWSCLGDNTWVNFEKQQISDSTLQLIQPGIISFVIPAGATTNNTIMPAGYLWLKAAVHEKPDAVCKLLSVQAQAAVVVFTDNNNEAGFLNTALPPATISKLKVPQAAVKSISQPYASFGGKPAESNEGYYRRVSERLRHKSRAITIWDYEHLVLEAFPLIHKVKCLNHTKSVNEDYNESVPGHVTIITVPDTRQRNDIDMLKPYTSQATLTAIKSFLQKKVSCHVQLHVVNPEFEQVRMKFKLKLARGFDDFTVYSKKLQEEITGFLSPWVYGTGEIGFGGRIYKSAIINFIEERPYVDFIDDVEMAHLSSRDEQIKPDNDEITATISKAILVSVPVSEHNILPV